MKTRLQTHCSAQTAAEIAKILMRTTISLATRHWPGEVVLAVWPDDKHVFFQQMVEEYGVRIIQQSSGDLGQKMSDAMQTTGFPVAVMGCDAPHCPPEVLHQVWQNLNQDTAAIGPATDGGYYLLALPTAAPELFCNVDWGTSRVLVQTLTNARSIDLSLLQLSSLRDIDEWEDLRTAAQTVKELKLFIAQPA